MAETEPNLALRDEPETLAYLASLPGVRKLLAAQVLEDFKNDGASPETLQQIQQQMATSPQTFEELLRAAATPEFLQARAADVLKAAPDDAVVRSYLSKEPSPALGEQNRALHIIGKRMGLSPERVRDIITRAGKEPTDNWFTKLTRDAAPAAGTIASQPLTGRFSSGVGPALFNLARTLSPEGSGWNYKTAPEQARKGGIGQVLRATTHLPPDKQRAAQESMIEAINRGHDQHAEELTATQKAYDAPQSQSVMDPTGGMHIGKLFGLTAAKEPTTDGQKWINAAENTAGHLVEPWNLGQWKNFRPGKFRGAVKPMILANTVFDVGSDIARNASSVDTANAGKTNGAWGAISQTLLNTGGDAHRRTVNDAPQLDASLKTNNWGRGFTTAVEPAVNIIQGKNLAASIPQLDNRVAQLLKLTPDQQTLAGAVNSWRAGKGFGTGYAEGIDQQGKTVDTALNKIEKGYQNIGGPNQSFLGGLSIYKPTNVFRAMGEIADSRAYVNNEALKTQQENQRAMEKAQRNVTWGTSTRDQRVAENQKLQPGGWDGVTWDHPSFKKTPTTPPAATTAQPPASTIGKPPGVFGRANAK
jgi:hypothetical protein